jgi:hypothetical protein
MGLNGQSYEDAVFAAIIREATHLEQNAQNACKTHRGGPVGYEPVLDTWYLADPTDVQTILRMERQKALVSGNDNADIKQALSPCEAHGFKFQTVTFTQDSGNGITITDTYGGRVCGHSPWTSWSVQISRTVDAEGDTASQSGTKQVSIPEGGTGSIFSGPDGSGAQLTVLPNAPAQMRISEQPNRGYAMTSAARQDVPLLDDETC